jgi:hypothetical protein
MGKAKFTDHFGNTVAGFERTLRNLPETTTAQLTLKEQLEVERTRPPKEVLKEEKERDRFIQDCPYFEK